MRDLEKLQNRHRKLVDYLQMKVEEADWHAVSDAANDLRVLEAQMAMLPEINAATASLVKK